MNTQLKVGDRVRVISGANIEGYDNEEGVINGFYSDVYKNIPDIMGVVFDKSPTIEVYCYSMSDRPLKYEILNTPQSVAIEQTPPTPKWLPIDRDNLPKYNVIAMKMGAGCYICALLGELTVDENGDIGVGELRTNPTHYIPLSDLLNLPISE